MSHPKKIILAMLFLTLVVLGFFWFTWDKLPGHFSMNCEGKGCALDQPGNYLCMTNSINYTCSLSDFLNQWIRVYSIFILVPLAFLSLAGYVSIKILHAIFHASPPRPSSPS